MRILKLLSVSIIVITMLLLTIGSSLADTTIGPGADAYTDRTLQGANHGSDLNLLLSASNATGGCTEMTYLWFKYIIPTGTITDAVLRLTFNTLGLGPTDVELRSSSDTSWNEVDPGGLNWGNQPELDLLVLDTATGANVGSTVSFQSAEFTSYLNSHQGQTVSLAVRADCDGAVSTSVALALASRENANGSGAMLELIGPTAVVLARFEAWPISTGHRVQWETVDEIDNVGFNLYRSTALEGSRVKLNRTLIPAKHPGSPSGEVYDWYDIAWLSRGRSYFYWLEDVDIHGNTTMHGPAKLRATLATVE